ncbi:MAG: response regulator [Moraxellaceae bacterium]|nr:response regulator [Moraxellaceae bacterium]MDZ4387584.1 response regulator [Moraxellaceae bacterium]
MAVHKILLMEDDEMTAELIEFLLKRQGHEVKTAIDGAEGEKLLSEWQPQLVVLDVLMPFVDGFTVLKNIRNNAVTKDLPVLMLTAKTGERDIVQALDMGANDYLVKPFQPAELLARINRLSREIKS